MKIVCDIFGIMPRFTCSICSAPPDVKAAVDQALFNGEPGRSIAKRSAFSKSAIYRHRQSCLPRDTLRRHSDKMANKAQPGRLIIKWGDDDGYWFGGERTELRENDVMITVIYENPPIRNAAVAENVERLPDDDKLPAHEPDEPEPGEREQVSG